MNKVKYKILKKNIPEVKLVSLFDRYWYDYLDQKIPWLDGEIIFPKNDDIVYNINESNSLKKGFYKWNISSWNLITGATTSEIYSKVFNDYNLPVMLENTIKDLGVMVGFSGDIEQINQKCNFTYSGNSYTIIVYNTINTNQLTTLSDSIFTIYWGDGSQNTLQMPKIGDTTLPSISHDYNLNGEYIIKVSINSPWKVEEVEKKISVPFISSYSTSDLGELTFSVPYTDSVIEQTQDYIENYSELTGLTPNATINFRGIGKSRIDEIKLYGKNAGYSGLTIVDQYSGYTIDNLFYVDYPIEVDGITYIETIISGSTTGSTLEEFYSDEVYNGMVTRNEYFLGFIEEPTIYSDIIVDRGKLGVMEKNFRLNEIDNTGELELYGNGYFKVRKQ